jgi:toxin ParE1/3/4
VARFNVSREARKDLSEIFVYIARDNVAAARRVLSLFHQKFRAIAAQPGIGRQRDELKAGYQSHTADNYVIYYRFANGIVRILRVLHGARDLKKLIP